MYAILQRAILFAAALTVPLQATNWTVAGYPVSASKAVTALLLVLVCLQVMFPAGRRAIPDRSLPFLGLFSASITVSAFVAVAHGQPLVVSLIASTRYFGLVLLYVALLLTVRSRKDLLVVLWGLALGGVVVSSPAVLKAMSGALFIRGERLEGLAGHPNTLAYEISIAIAILVGLYFAARSRVVRMFLVIGAAVILLAIIGSLSRSAFASLVVMWGFWVFRSGRLDTLKYVVPAMAVAVLMLAFLPEPVQERMATVLDPAQRRYDAGTHGRLFQAEWAFRAFLSNPIAGVGLANIVPWAQGQPGGHQLTYTVHNTFLYIMCTQGLLGLIPFVGLHIFAWRDYTSVLRIAAARRGSRDPLLEEFRNYALFLQLALLGTLVGGMGHQESASKGLWIVLAVSAATLHLARARASELDSQLVPVFTGTSTSVDYGSGRDKVLAAG